MNKKVINISLILLLASTGSVFAQQGFGTNRPDKSAAVDITSENKGLLIPRMNLTWENNAVVAPVSSPAKGLLVYNKTTTPNVPQGFYYFTDGKWNPIGVSDLKNGENTIIVGTGTASDPYKVNVAKATASRLGVVKIGSGINVDTNGVISVPAAPGETTTVITDALTGTNKHKIADYKNETTNPVVDIFETVTSLSQNIDGISYTDETGTKSAAAKIVSKNTDNIISVDADFGALLTKEDVQDNQITYEVVPGKNTTVEDGGSTVDVKKYKVNVATANDTSLGVVAEAATNPTVDVTAGVLSVNLTNTILAGEVTGPLNKTIVEDDVIDADNLKANAVTTAKILDANVTTAKIADKNVTTSKITPAATYTTTKVLVTDTTGAVNWVDEATISPVKVVEHTSVLNTLTTKVDAATSNTIDLVKKVDAELTGKNLSVTVNGVTHATPVDLTSIDTNTITTVSRVQPYVSVTPTQTNGSATAGINTIDYEIGVALATTEEFGVVMPGTGLTIVKDGILDVDTSATGIGRDITTDGIITVNGGVNLQNSVLAAAELKIKGGTEGQVLTTTAPGKVEWAASKADVETKITNTVTGHKIADYTNELNNVVPINETVTSLSQDATGISYTNENNTNTLKAKVVSANANNLVKTGTDFGAFLAKEDVQTSQIKYEVIHGENTTAQLDPTSTNDLKKYKVDVAKASGANWGVVKIGSGINVSDGVISVPAAPGETTTEIKDALTGTNKHKIADYKNETGNPVVDIFETVTSLSQDKDGIYYTNENGGAAVTAKVVSANTGNLITTGTDHGATLTKLDVQNNQMKYEVVPGTNTTVLDGGSTTDLTKFKVNVATANDTSLGVVAEAATNPTVDVTAGVLSVNLTNTILDGEVTGPLNKTIVKDDVIDAANLKANAVTTDKILNKNVTPAKIEGGTEGQVLTTNTAGEATWVTPTDNNTDNQTLTLNPLNNTLSIERGNEVELNLVSLAGEVTGPINNTVVANDVIDAANLKADAVTTAKILNANVTTDKIADQNVTTAKIKPASASTTSSTPTTQVMVTDPSGVVKWVDASTITPVSEVKHVSNLNNLVTTVDATTSNTIALVKTVDAKLTGNELTVTVNGVDDTAPLDLSSIDTNTITTVAAKTGQSYVTVDQIPSLPGATGNREYKVGVDKATENTLGVVMPGTNVTVDATGKLNVATAEENTVTRTVQTVVVDGVSAQVEVTNSNNDGVLGLVKPNEQFNVATDGTMSIKYAMPQFFYMPSILIDTSVVAPTTDKTINLYTQYTQQFNVANANMRSTNAPAKIPVVPAATDLYYYVTYSDADAIEIVSISDSGIMTYRVKSNTNSLSFVNIVFVIK